MRQFLGHLIVEVDLVFELKYLCTMLKIREELNQLSFLSLSSFLISVSSLNHPANISDFLAVKNRMHIRHDIDLKKVECAPMLR